MSNRAVSQETGTDMVKTRNGKTNNQESASAPLTKWEAQGAGQSSPVGTQRPGGQEDVA